MVSEDDKDRRDLFAALAMQVLLKGKDEYLFEDVARSAYEMAEWMLIEREKPVV